MKTDRLSREEIGTLGESLERLAGTGAMNLETMDGFFAALICGPDLVMPTEYLPEVLGDLSAGDPEVALNLLDELVPLILRHWNGICGTLESGDIFLPLLLEDEQGFAPANDWANGFLRGMDMRRGSWSGLVADEERGGSFIPIFALAYEHDPDPEMRPYDEPMDAGRREQLIVGVAAGVTKIYRHFAAERRRRAPQDRTSAAFRRAARKVGRNHPCPCGSGRKFKVCCATLPLP